MDGCSVSILYVLRRHVLLRVLIGCKEAHETVRKMKHSMYAQDMYPVCLLMSYSCPLPSGAIQYHARRTGEYNHTYTHDADGHVRKATKQV